MDSAYKSAVEAIARVNAEDTVQVVRRRNDAAAAAADAHVDHRAVQFAEEMSDIEKSGVVAGDGCMVAMSRRAEMVELEQQRRRRMEEAVGRRAAVIGRHISAASSHDTANDTACIAARNAGVVDCGRGGGVGARKVLRDEVAAAVPAAETLTQQVKGVEVEATEVKDLTSVKHASAVPPPLRSPRCVYITRISHAHGLCTSPPRDVPGGRGPFSTEPAHSVCRRYGTFLLLSFASSWKTIATKGKLTRL